VNRVHFHQDLADFAPVARILRMQRGGKLIGTRQTAGDQLLSERLEQVARLPSGVTVDVQVGGESAPETRVIFRPTGSLEGRTTALVLANKEKSQTVTITGATGAVSVQ
jgi:hypothetical protein